MFRVISSYDYLSTIRVSLSQLRSIKRAQIEVRDTGLVLKNTSLLQEKLGAYAGVLSLAFASSTPASVAFAVAGILATWTSGVPSLDHYLVYGNYELDKLIYWMEDHPQYDMIEVQFPFLEYKSDMNETVRFIQGFSATTVAWTITAVHVTGSSGWQIWR